MNVGFMVTYTVHIIGGYRSSGKRESAPFLKILSPPTKKIIVNWISQDQGDTPW